MRILFVLHLPPPVHGAAMVGQYIRESQHINACFDGYYINLSTAASVDDIGKRGLKKLLRYAGIVWKTLYRAIVFRPDLVYLTLTAKGGGFYKDASIVLLLKLLGKKVVFHFHNKGITDYQHRKPDHFLYKQVFRNSSVILLSKSLKYDVANYVDDKRIYYCPNGSAGISASTSAERSPAAVPNILFIANLAESKGIYDLLEALSGVQELGSAFECNIVGGEGTIGKDELHRKIAELGLEGSVTYRGQVVGKDKEQLLREADLFVHPPHDECFGLVLLEAMSAGLPVIATIEGGIPDIVVHGETGFLVEKKNVDELRGRILELLGNAALREKFGAKGRERFAERFTMERFEQQFIDILNNITRENKCA